MGRSGPFKNLTWGRLNPGNRQRTQRTASSSQRTSLMSQVRQNTVDTATPKNAPTGPMKGIVLRVDPPTNQMAQSSFLAGWYDEVLGIPQPEMIAMKVRIPTLHAAIPEPEKYDCGSGPGKHQFWINMHPTFYASSQDIEMPECGDMVVVSVSNPASAGGDGGGMVVANVVTRENDGGMQKGGACPPSDAAAAAETTPLAAEGGEGDAIGGEEVSNALTNPFNFPEDCDWECMSEILGSITTMPPVAPGRNPNGEINYVASPFDKKGIFISRGTLLDPNMPQPLAALKRCLWANISYVVMECVEQYSVDAKDRYAQKDVFKAYARMFQLGGVRVYVSGKPYPGKAAKFVRTMVDYAEFSGAKAIVMEPTWGYLSPGDKDKYARQAEYLTSAMMKAGKEHSLQVGFTNPWLPSATYTIAELDGEEGSVAIRYKDSFPYACFSKVDWNICQILSSNGKSNVYYNESTGQVSLLSLRGENALKQEDFVTALEDYFKMGFKNIIPAFGVMGTGWEDYRVSSDKPPGRVREELDFLAADSTAAHIGPIATEPDAPVYVQSPGFEMQGEDVADWSTGYFGLTYLCSEDDPDSRCATEDTGLSLEEAVDLGGDAADLAADLTGDEGMEDIADAFDVAAEVIDEAKEVTSQAFPGVPPHDPPIKAKINYSVTWWDWLNAEFHTPCWKSTRWDIIKNFNRYSPLGISQAQEGEALNNLSYETFGKQIQDAIDKIAEWNRVAEHNPAMQKLTLEMYMMAVNAAPSMTTAFGSGEDVENYGEAASHVAQSAATELGYDGEGSGLSDVDSAAEEYSDSSSDIPDPDAFFGSDPTTEGSDSGAAAGEDSSADGTGGDTSQGAAGLSAYPAFGYIDFNGGRNPDDKGGWYPAHSGNYTTQNRTPAEITHFVIHTTAGRRQTAGGDEFVKVGKQASTHYGINQGGWVFQFVKEKDRAWGQGVKSGTKRGDSWGLTAQDKTNGKENPGGISVEISGIPEEEANNVGGTYPDVVYENLAYLIANVCHRNQIPVDRQHIFGHDELVNSRSDPGTKLQGIYPDGISYPLNSTPEGGDMVPGRSHQINSFGVNVQGNETLDWARLLDLVRNFMTTAGVPMPPAHTFSNQGSNSAGASAPGGGGAAAPGGGANAPIQCGPGGAAGVAGTPGAPLTPAQIAAMGDIAQNGAFPIGGTPVITSDFGPRNPPGPGASGGASSPHQGIDLASTGGPPSRPAGGCPLLAPADGVISGMLASCPNEPDNEAKRACGGHGGNIVYIDHGNGIRSAHMHLYSVAAGITTGVTVTKGQVLGTIGNSGNSFGPHNHFEWRLGATSNGGSGKGERVDPSRADILNLQCEGYKCPPGNQNFG